MFGQGALVVGVDGAGLQFEALGEVGDGRVIFILLRPGPAAGEVGIIGVLRFAQDDLGVVTDGPVVILLQLTDTPALILGAVKNRNAADTDAIGMGILDRLGVVGEGTGQVLGLGERIPPPVIITRQCPLLVGLGLRLNNQPVVVQDCPGVIIGLQPRAGQQLARLRQVGIELDRLGIIGEGALAVAFTGPALAAVAVGGGHVRFQFDGLGIVGDGLVQFRRFVGLAPAISPPEVGAGDILAGGDFLVQLGDGLVIFTAHRQPAAGLELGLHEGILFGRGLGAERWGHRKQG